MTLFVSPRPTEAMINSFYRDSDSSRFWAERFFPETAQARRIKIFRPRARLAARLIRKYKVPAPAVLADVGAGFGIFLEEARRTGIFEGLIGIEPSRDLAACCRKKAFTVVEKPMEEIGADEVRASVACSFEVLEHLFDPERFIGSIARMLRPGGLLIFTTLTISGLDLQVLWERSKSISPPHHINFLSIEGLKRLIARCGMDEVEISTPGKLDVDIIRNMMMESEGVKVPRFIEYMIKHRDPETAARFQRFLQANNLSSHARVIARKR
jgi:2-polyprenyl-3-methyl-5-hydroxy-6-metoxy-1,4-benzoquinol methylase